MTSTKPTPAEQIAEQGYAVLEGVLDHDLVDALVDDLDRLHRDLDVQPATNGFEGHDTLRVYNLLVHGELWQQVPVHAAVLPVVEQVLDPGCLISSLSSITILPGEAAQPIHADDQLIPIPKPHPPTVCNTMWALTDFTDANGATRLVPGSHLSSENPIYGGEYETIAAEMPKGSVLVWHGSPVARRRRQPHRRAPRRHRHELLRRLHPPAGEPAARRARRRWRARSRSGCSSCSATPSTTGSSATSTSTTLGRCCSSATPHQSDGLGRRRPVADRREAPAHDQRRSGTDAQHEGGDRRALPVDAALRRPRARRRDGDVEGAGDPLGRVEGGVGHDLGQVLEAGLGLDRRGEALVEQQAGGEVHVGGVEQHGEHRAAVAGGGGDEAAAGAVGQTRLHADGAGIEVEQLVAAVDDVVDAVAAEEADLLGADDRHQLRLGQHGPGDDGEVARRDEAAAAVAELVVEPGGVGEVGASSRPRASAVEPATRSQPSSEPPPTRSARATAASLADTSSIDASRSSRSQVWPALTLILRAGMPSATGEIGHGVVRPAGAARRRGR